MIKKELHARNELTGIVPAIEYMHTIFYMQYIELNHAHQKVYIFIRLCCNFFKKRKKLPS